MRFVVIFLGLTLAALPRPVRAANPRAEAAALDALNKAESDYLGMNYASGAARLDKALRACAPANCSAVTQAALMRDIGTMEFRAGDKGLAATAFGEALKLQPGIDLNPSYDSADLRAAWNEVKGGGAAPPPPPSPVAPSAPVPPPAPVSPPISPPPTFPQPKGDFTHTPAAEQKIDTPLPIYVEGGPSGVYHVIVRYKHSEESDDSDWNHMDLAHIGRGWGGLIACNAMLAGTLRYYIQAYNKDMDPVGANGDAKNPYQVTVREDLFGSPPHLPNKNPPRVCHEKAKNEGPTRRGEATEPPSTKGSKDAEDEISSENQGKEGEGGATKKNPGNALRRWWVGVGVHLDFLQMPQGADLCRLFPRGSPMVAQPANDRHIYCYAPDTQSDFPPHTPMGESVNNELQKGFAGNSTGGIVPANLRIFASIEYAINANFLAGLRGGYVFLRYPGTQAVSGGYAFGSGVYAEARVTAVIGRDALKTGGLSPIVFAGGGVSAFDAHTSDTATLCATPSTACTMNMISQPVPTKVDLWWSNGPGFVDVGGGLRYAPTPQYALIGALRVNLSFGTNGLIPTVGPEVGGQIGF